MIPKYECPFCKIKSTEQEIIEKVLSVTYRPTYDNIQAFKQIKCPICKTLIIIVFETIDCNELKR